MAHKPFLKDAVSQPFKIKNWFSSAAAVSSSAEGLPYLEAVLCLSATAFSKGLARLIDKEISFFQENSLISEFSQKTSQAVIQYYIQIPKVWPNLSLKEAKNYPAK